MSIDDAEVPAARPDRAWFAGRRVLVTGHTGFKGAWLCVVLDRLGAEVHGLALAPPSSPSLFDALGPACPVRDARLDVRDRDAVSARLRAVRPELVVHLAGQPLVSVGHDDPVGTFATNVLGTAHVLDAVERVGGVRAVVVATTDKVYRDPGHAPLHEDAPLGGDEPYGASKAAAEHVVSAFRARWLARPDGPGLVSVRAGNVIGGGDHGRDRLVPDAVRAVVDGVPLHLRHPDATRPFQHVLDPLHGYLLAAERLAQARDALPPSLHFGPPSTSARVADVVDRFVALLGRGRPDVRVGARFHEARALSIDSSLARVSLGYRPRCDLETTLALTASLYGRLLDGGRGEALRAAMDAQIESTWGG